MKSLLDKKEVSQARTGPRELKDPRSREYAIQTVYALKRYVKSRDIDAKRVNEELNKIKKYRHWEVLGYGSKDALLEAEIGYTEAEVERKILTHQEAGALGGRGKKASVNNNSFKPNERGSTNKSYLLARLERDHKSILDDYHEGKYPSVRQAAIAAGIVKVPTPFQAIVKLIPKLSATEKQELRLLLQ